MMFPYTFDYEQAISACEFQGRSEKRKGHKRYALQMVFRSKVPS